MIDILNEFQTQRNKFINRIQLQQMINSQIWTQNLPKNFNNWSFITISISNYFLQSQIGHFGKLYYANKVNCLRTFNLNWTLLWFSHYNCLRHTTTANSLFIAWTDKIQTALLMNLKKQAKLWNCIPLQFHWWH